VDAKTDYKGQGVDQIAEVVRQIKSTPDSRRILLSAWNVSALALALVRDRLCVRSPPTWGRWRCRHATSPPSSGSPTASSPASCSSGPAPRSPVRGSCGMWVCLCRSCDLGLGVPFNIASYALLTVLLAHACGVKPGEFVHALGECVPRDPSFRLVFACAGDYHVYSTHIEPLREQIGRAPRPFPTLSVKRPTPVTSTKNARFTLTGGVCRLPTSASTRSPTSICKDITPGPPSKCRWRSSSPARTLDCNRNLFPRDFFAKRFFQTLAFEG
jgi:thymidylate synthase